jgi:hypothetical protein
MLPELSIPEMPSFSHMILGKGLPVTTHLKTATSPSFIWITLGLVVTFGGSKLKAVYIPQMLVTFIADIRHYILTLTVMTHLSEQPNHATHTVLVIH